MENQNELEFKIEMATLDLKGRRYREAVDKFSDLTRMTNNAGAWSGLALAKLGLITEDVTVIEVFHCLTNALNKSENKKEIYTLSIEAAKEAIKELYEVYVNAILISREAKKDAFKHKINSVAGAFFTVDSHMSKRNTSSAIGAGLTALSYNGYLNSKNTAEEFNRAAERLKDLISEIVEQTKDFNSANDNAEVNEFENFIASADLKAVELTKTEKEKETEKIKLEEERKRLDAQTFIENSKKILEDKTHVFHEIKKAAIDAFHDAEYETCIRSVNEAAKFVNYDKELIDVLNKSRDKLNKNANKKSLKEFLITFGILALILLLFGNLKGGVSKILGLLILILPIIPLVRHFVRKYKISSL